MGGRLTVVPSERAGRMRAARSRRTDRRRTSSPRSSSSTCPVRRLLHQALQHKLEQAGSRPALGATSHERPAAAHEPHPAAASDVPDSNNRPPSQTTPTCR